MTVTLTSVRTLGGSTTWTYESKDEMTQEASTRNSNYTHNFAYDSAGNPTTFKGSSQSFNSNNQRTSDTHDNNGNPTTSKSTSCTYDVENRLTAYGSALSCGYRGDGLRAWKQPGGGSKTYFLYDGTDIVCELDSSGNVSAHMTYGPDGLVSRRSGSATTWYAFDAHGSVALTLDPNGDAVSKHGWDAYGSSLGTAPSGPFGYGAQWGYYTDSETGLCALAFRAYDPATGRFLTRDPIGYAGGVNLYGYVGNGPGSGVDPLGLETLVFGGTKLKVFGDDGRLLGTFEAWSGKPGTTRGDTDRAKIGPIPQGTWRLRPGEVGWASWWLAGRNFFGTSGWGEGRIEIFPEPGTDTYGRKGIFVHGGSPGNGKGSAGCIDLGPAFRDVYEMIRHREQVKVIVSYAGWNGGVPNDPWPYPPKTWGAVTPKAETHSFSQKGPPNDDSNSAGGR